MVNRVTKNDIPGIEDIKSALLSVLSSGRSRSFENIQSDVAKALGLTKAQRAYRIGRSKNTLFENRLTAARSELVNEGLITYKAKKVKLVRNTSPTVFETSLAGKEKKQAGTKRSTPDGRSTMCLAFQQPSASYIATGLKDVEFRAWRFNAPIKNLVVCASKTPKRHPPVPGLPYGMAVGMVDVVKCVGVKGNRAWKLENPRMIVPFEVHATASVFYVAEQPKVIPSTVEAYREFVLPACYRGLELQEEEMIASLFASTPDAKFRYFYGWESQRFSVAKRHYPYNVSR